MMSTDSSNPDSPPPRKIQRVSEYPASLRFISLDREFFTEVSTVTFAILKNVDKKYICKILKELPELSINYRHLKRVNEEKHLLVAPIEEIDVEKFLMQITEKYGSGIEVYYKDVSATQSELRLHFEKANLLWPVKFIENKENEKLYWNRCIDDSEFYKYYCLLKSMKDDKGCIIYDPKIDKILVQTVDNPKVPLAHAVMNAAKELTKLNEAERYYAFECDVILSHEPCVMCAMALNHMRASRVFFHRDDQKIGAFTRTKLHRNWTSCYRYNVLRIDY